MTYTSVLPFKLFRFQTFSNVRGFTLIELSVVLVIIGLIVGGVLVGRDLIGGSAVRAQISQIDQFQQAVTAFDNKYDSLPGDINAANAARFGFAARGTYPGQGDGNGVLEGNYQNYNSANNGAIECCENLLFWRDLSQAGLITNSFTLADATSTASITKPMMNQYFPESKIGAASLAGSPSLVLVFSNSGSNYFGLQGIFANMPSSPAIFPQPNLTVKQAYAMDSKIDDGKPQSGSVLAATVNYSPSFSWADGGSFTSSATPDTSAYAASATTCADNGNVAGYRKYSIAYNSGAGQNCYLSFKFQ